MMEFKSGFWQLKMVLEAQQYTTFTCMPFGPCNAPVTFQCLMQNILGELNLKYCIIYLDDMIVFGHLEEEHLEHLCVVLSTIGNTT